MEWKLITCFIRLKDGVDCGFMEDVLKKCCVCVCVCVLFVFGFGKSYIWTYVSSSFRGRAKIWHIGFFGAFNLQPTRLTTTKWYKQSCLNFQVTHKNEVPTKYFVNNINLYAIKATKPNHKCRIHVLSQYTVWTNNRGRKLL